MKKHIVLLLAFMFAVLGAHAQLKVGAEFSTSRLWMSGGYEMGSRMVLATPAIKAEYAFGKRWTLATGLRYSTAVHYAGGYPMLCFAVPDFFSPPRIVAFAEAPLGVKYRFNPNSSSKWTLSLSAAATVAKATRLSSSTLFLGPDGTLQTSKMMPWVFGGEMGAEASRSLGRHLTVDFSTRLKAAATTHIIHLFRHRLC